jgi:hypothetical protein
MRALQRIKQKKQEMKSNQTQNEISERLKQQQLRQSREEKV